MYKIFLKLVEFISRAIAKVYVPFNKRKIRAKNYREIKEKIRPGDLIFLKRYGYLSNLFIGKWPHVALAGRDEKVIEATAEGVVETDLIDVLLSRDEVEIWRPKFLQPHEKTEAADYAKTFIGTDYDFTFQNDMSTLYCSELILLVYNFDAFKLKKRYGSDTFIPDDFLNYKKYFEVIYAVKE